MRCAADSRYTFFSLTNGSLEGPYRHTQPRIYSASVNGGGKASSSSSLARWGAQFQGALASYAVPAKGGLIAAGHLGTEVQIYSQDAAASDFTQRPGWPGTYERISAAEHSPRIAFVYSSLRK